ncbi:MAG TPA: hypothetical protein VFQ85_07540 [Mycobacteriales bacterium]|jgi:hypothetical protein|nr:hypothetical protein [Mycobacteriales bacterium]
MYLREFASDDQRRVHTLIDTELAHGCIINTHVALSAVFGLEPSDRGRLDRAAPIVPVETFDFVVHDAATHRPLFAVEFDEGEPDPHMFDKNLLCATAFLGLLRFDARHLHEIEELTLVAWLARRWRAYESAMPGMIADRDADIAAMDPQEFEAAGSFLIGDHPELDVELVFDLEHPYPPLVTIANRLWARHRAMGTRLREIAQLDLGRDEPRWVIVEDDGLPRLGDELRRHYRHVARVKRWPSTRDDAPSASFTGMYEVELAYPIGDGPVPSVEEQYAMIFAEGRFPYAMPPAGVGLSHLGPQVAWYNALREVEQWLDRQ